MVKQRIIQSVRQAKDCSARKRARRVRVRAIVHADTQPIDQLATQPDP